MNYANYDSKYRYKKKSVVRKKLNNIIRKIFDKGHEHLTVMFIPHSEKKIFNFQLSNFALIFIILLVSSLTAGGAYFFIDHDNIERNLNNLNIDYLESTKELNDIAIIIPTIKANEKKLSYTTRQLRTLTAGASNKTQPQSIKGENIGGPGSEAKGYTRPNRYKDQNFQAKELSQLGRNLGFLQKDLGKTITLIKGYQKIFKNMPSIFPVFGRGYVVSGFGWRRDPFTYKMTLHRGVDIVNIPGTPIVATADGYVLKAERGGGRGIYVELRHKFGYTTQYLHLSSLGVRSGDYVKKRQVIGYLGSTGRSTGPHLHYEVRVNNINIDPSPFISLDKFPKSNK